MEKKDISIIIPAYNEEGILQKSLNAAKKQDTKLCYEIIVVDNNSVDKTKEIAKKNKVKVINEKKQGVGAARRTGTEKSNGKIIVHIDADSVIPPNHLEKVWEHFQKDRSLVCLGGQFLFYDAPLWKNILRKLLYRPILCFAKIISNGTLGPSGNNMAFRKDAYKKTCGFDKNLKFGEDMDLCRKLKKVGKIKTDITLKVKTSSRRYKLDKKFVIYVANFLSLCFKGRPHRNALPECK